MMTSFMNSPLDDKPLLYLGVCIWYLGVCILYLVVFILYLGLCICYLGVCILYLGVCIWYLWVCIWYSVVCIWCFFGMCILYLGVFYMETRIKLAWVNKAIIVNINILEIFNYCLLEADQAILVQVKAEEVFHGRQVDQVADVSTAVCFNDSNRN